VHGDKIESLLYWNNFVYNGHIIKREVLLQTLLDAAPTVRVVVVNVDYL
jgi:hypothetical protein